MGSNQIAGISELVLGLEAELFSQKLKQRNHFN